ncbi:hypothetical protein [Gluconacetobacter diazotrophicus]|uniref:hypothetical protein n=1 Tax=Gluconacetobacter diazotrophicus TaxID=33996 RepID=UPI0012FF1958|nr:hypothetical protein [Gluconacetobacter diazotrophicus]
MFASDSFSFPGANPNHPPGDAENLRRVRGDSVAIKPLTPEPGNIWPDALDKLSAADGKDFAGDERDAQAELLPGESLGLGEEAAIRNGVQIADTPIPKTKTPDRNNRVAPDGDTMIIPSSDGGSTVISANGEVRIIKGGARQ